MATIDELHAQSVQGDLNPLMAKIIGALRTGAEFVSPPANGPGAAAVAGIRSLLPGSGSFSQEFDRYNRAAAPSPLYSGPERFGSIVKEPGALGPSQGESEQARQMALQTQMAAMLLSHGSPSIWAPEPGKPLGQFRRTFKHSGEGSAYRGAGAYAAQEPEVTRTYRERAPWTFTIDGQEVDKVVRGPPTPAGRSVDRPGPRTAADEVARELRKRFADDMLEEHVVTPSNVASYLRAIGAEVADEVMSAKDTLAAAQRSPDTFKKLAASQALREADASGGARYGSLQGAMLATDPVAFYQKELDTLMEKMKLINELRNAPERIGAKKGGSYYTVDFPDELLPNVLDLEKPLIAQGPEVRIAFDNLFQTPTVVDTVARQKYGRGLADKEGFHGIRSPVMPPEVLERVKDELASEIPFQRLQRSDKKNSATGWDFYETLSNFLRMEGHNQPELASRALNEAGIPAQKFRDRFSRKDSTWLDDEAYNKATRNFVIFDPDNTLTTLGKHKSILDMEEFQAQLEFAKKNPRLPPTNPEVQAALDILRGMK